MKRRSRKKDRLLFERVVIDTNNPFLATAVFVEAHYLISRDKDLLVLKKFHEVKIVKPEEFIKLYKHRQ